MDKKNWKKIEWLLFIIAVILVLLLTALYIYFENFFLNGKEAIILQLVNQVIPNLIAVLIVVIFIYVFLKSRGIDTNEQFREELENNFITKIKANISPKNIDMLVQKIVAYKSPKFMRLDYSKELFQFSEKLKIAKSIWINGYSCAELFREFKSEIKWALINGTDFKIIITEPNSIATKMMEERHSHPESVKVDIDYVKAEIKEIRKDISNTNKRNIGRIDVKLIDWLPSCSMIFSNPDKEDGELKIRVYPPYYASNHRNPIEMIIDRKTDPDQFEYFHEQYNRLWNKENNNPKDVRKSGNKEEE